MQRLIELSVILKRKGWTQRYLAIQAHMSEVVLSKAITGERELEESKKKVIAKLLGVEKDRIFP